MIRVESLCKRFQTRRDDVLAVDGVDFEAAAGEMITLLGPSGCGKTTTLRCVAGLERPERGAISIGDQKVVDCQRGLFIPPHRRRLGMVFQSYAIWPHMTVYENVAYALEGERLARSEVRRRASEALALVKLDAFADRPAPRLSGGQQQRVAIARAIAGHPQALLFDEPLSNLDAKLRAEMRTELRRLQQQVGITSIYVTHDQSEALAISDWIIVMRNGRIVERGRPADIYTRPRSLFTAHFIGHTNLIPGTVSAPADNRGKVMIETAFGPMAGLDPAGDLGTGDEVRLSIRPEDMELIDAPTDGGLNTVSGRVVVATFQGSVIEAEIAAGDQVIQGDFGRDVSLERGTELTLTFAAENAVVLRDEPLEDDGEDKGALEMGADGGPSGSS